MSREGEGPSMSVKPPFDLRSNHNVLNISLSCDEESRHLTGGTLVERLPRDASPYSALMVPVWAWDPFRCVRYRSTFLSWSSTGREKPSKENTSGRLGNQVWAGLRGESERANRHTMESIIRRPRAIVLLCMIRSFLEPGKLLLIGRLTLFRAAVP